MAVDSDPIPPGHSPQETVNMFHKGMDSTRAAIEEARRLNNENLREEMDHAARYKRTFGTAEP